MSENDDDTLSSGTGDPADAGSKDGKDPVSLLTSRLNGQTAKVGELTGRLSAKDEALAAALKRVADLESGTVKADEAATARVAAVQKELEKERNERRVDSLKARFPETFSVFGDGVFSMDETVLAASEARLTGDAGEDDDPPTPLRHNETRSGAAKGGPAKEKTAADIRAELLSTPVPWA